MQMETSLYEVVMINKEKEKNFLLELYFKMDAKKLNFLDLDSH